MEHQDLLGAGVVLIPVVALIFVMTMLKDREIASQLRSTAQGRPRGEDAAFAAQLHFLAVDRPAADVLDALQAGVTAAHRVPVGSPATHLLGRGDKQIRWACGNETQQLWTATARVVGARTAPAARHGVELRFADTTEVDGLVFGLGAMRTLRRELQLSLENLESKPDPGCCHEVV